MENNFDDIKNLEKKVLKKRTKKNKVSYTFR